MTGSSPGSEIVLLTFQAVLINCLLRNYLNYNLYNQADKLVLKSTFPEQASNSEWAR